MFGRERHLMPFNDFYMLNVGSKFEATRSLFLDHLCVVEFEEGEFNEVQKKLNIDKLLIYLIGSFKT